MIVTGAHSVSFVLSSWKEEDADYEDEDEEGQDGDRKETYLHHRASRSPRQRAMINEGIMRRNRGERAIRGASLLNPLTSLVPGLP